MLLFSFLLLRNLFSNDRCCSVFLLVFSFSCSMNSSTEMSRSAKREAISKRMSKLKVGGEIRYFFLTCEKNRLRSLIGRMVFFTCEEDHLNHAMCHR